MDSSSLPSLEVLIDDFFRIYLEFSYQKLIVYAHEHLDKLAPSLNLPILPLTTIHPLSTILPLALSPETFPTFETALCLLVIHHVGTMNLADELEDTVRFFAELFASSDTFTITPPMMAMFKIMRQNFPSYALYRESRDFDVFIRSTPVKYDNDDPFHRLCLVIFASYQRSVFAGEGVPSVSLETYDELLEDSRFTKSKYLLYFLKARSLDDHDDIEESIRNYSLALEINPRLATALYNRANVYDQERMHSRALLDYNACLAINPHIYDAAFNRTILLKKMHCVEESKASGYEALRLNPADPEIYRLLGTTHISLEEYGETIRMFIAGVKAEAKLREFTVTDDLLERTDDIVYWFWNERFLERPDDDEESEYDDLGMFYWPIDEDEPVESVRFKKETQLLITEMLITVADCMHSINKELAAKAADGLKKWLGRIEAQYTLELLENKEYRQAIACMIQF